MATNIRPGDLDAAVARYASVRALSRAIAAPLTDADATVQPMPDASPAKWHLAHTSWFFETFVLRDHVPGYRLFEESWAYLFNSYYEGEGPRHPRPKRGMLSRPGLAETREGFVPQIIRGEKVPLAGAIQVANEAQALSLPLYGRIAAGTPIEALRDNSTTVDVPVTLLSSGAHYCLEVQGDSMVEAGIHNGDIAIIKSSDTADSGEIVVALIDDTEATLKRLRKKGASIALEPANAAYETRIFGPDRVKIQGKLAGLYRRYN